MRVSDLFTTTAEALVMASTTPTHATSRSVAISNHVQASLHIARRQTSVAMAIVPTSEALRVARAPAAVVGTFW